ncbi:radical SAM protein [Streptomyces sp. NPDC005648]|uniref:radical SAM protein n=1 Tax=Streptomyces sp. NPDC005648 TaxID=3157044 RepID=UPI0033BF76B5
MTVHLEADAVQDGDSDAAALGVEKVQFIGGEATQRPDFAELLQHALAVRLGVQVYSNLYRVPLRLWELFEHPRVSLATSYYSDEAADHERVTGRTGSHAATRANIIEALRRGIHVQVGIVAVQGASASTRRAPTSNRSACASSTPTGSAVSATPRRR